MPRYTYVVLTNPMEGREDEFNDWYDNQHLADVLSIPGFVGAKRFRVAPEATNDAKWRYLSIYEIETDDLTGALKELVARGGTSAMPISEALDLSTAHAVAYLPWTPGRSKSGP